ARSWRHHPWPARGRLPLHHSPDRDLGPGVRVAGARRVRARRAERPLNPARWIATGLGSGFFPVAPGTAGSLVGLASWLLLPEALRGAGLVGVGFLLAAFLAGVLACGVAEREFGHDAGPIVFDEVVGQWIALAAFSPRPLTLAAAFLLFRIFDV